LGGQENDVIHDDIRTLIGSNKDDYLIGSELADTIVGAAPVGTGNGVVDTPAGNDWIFGQGGDDTLVGGDRGVVAGGTGNDSLVGGRSTAASARTIVRGNEGNDTIVSGLGNDELIGDAGSNTLAYASVEQQGLDIVNRGTNGVTATLPNTGQTATGGRTGGSETDIIHDDIATLVGGNGNDVLTGNDLNNTILGVAPAGTAGVKPGPAGNDTLVGAGGVDILLGAEGNDSLTGGLGGDVLSAGAGNDANFAKDGVVDTITCGVGTDSLSSDTNDLNPAADCETVTH
jgi:Ca2+-binding RTX toxin-like protein